MADKLPIRIEPMLGEASQHAKMLLDIANVTGRDVYEEFNGDDIIAHPGDTAEGVYEEWRYKKHKRQIHIEVFR